MEAVITHSCNCMTYMVVLITITEKELLLCIIVT